MLLWQLPNLRYYLVRIQGHFLLTWHPDAHKGLSQRQQTQKLKLLPGTPSEPYGFKVTLEVTQDCLGWILRTDIVTLFIPVHIPLARTCHVANITTSTAGNYREKHVELVRLPISTINSIKCTKKNIVTILKEWTISFWLSIAISISTGFIALD
jgi:hypothetical protein